MPRKATNPEVDKVCRRCGEHGSHGTTKRGKSVRVQSWCRECCHLYAVWRQMIQRCTNANHPRYRRYGERGIEVCASWRKSFDRFESDMGPRPSAKHTLGRIDNDGPYKPSNCRWETAVQQQRNTARSRTVTCGGETKTLAEWAEQTGLHKNTLQRRVEAGWEPDHVVTEPTKNKPASPEELELVARRLREGVSQKRIAEELGRHPVTVNRWIKKKRHAST